MLESWRWFGPNDPVTLEEIRQTGATEIVSALHDIPIGAPWPIEAIRAHKAKIEDGNRSGAELHWTVVESIPVHDDIKLALPGHERYVENWVETLRNLADEGVKAICYNFMPVIDWTRTDLKHQLPNGAYTLRFDQDKFAAFDLFILEREGAVDEYSSEEIARAQNSFEAMREEDRSELTRTIIAGLPGKMTDAYSLDDFRKALARYKNIDHATLRKNLFAFLNAVTPHAEQTGMKLVIHPDDPPWDMFGLPRIICTPDDLNMLFNEVPSLANGMTLCVGTYGSRPDNDLPEMALQFAPRIHFAHLRGVSRDQNEPRTFEEASHLDSDTDMVGVIRNLLHNEKNSGSEIYIRPDHGFQMMGDITRPGNPGYSAIGRMKGLAEVRGVIKALSD